PPVGTGSRAHWARSAAPVPRPTRIRTSPSHLPCWPVALRSPGRSDTHSRGHPPDVGAAGRDAGLTVRGGGVLARCTEKPRCQNGAGTRSSLPPRQGYKDVAAISDAQVDDSRAAGTAAQTRPSRFRSQDVAAPVVLRTGGIRTPLARGQF